MPAIAWSASADTFRFTYVSPAAETILGYPAQAWIDEPHFWTDHIHPEDLHVARICHNETMAGRDHELVYRMVAADGRTVWLRDYVNVHKINGQSVELFGVMVDITREQEAEAASRENRENFRRMVELSPDCIGVHVDGRYVYVNQAFVELVGARDESEIVGRNAFSFLAGEYAHVAEARMARLRNGEAIGHQREKYTRLDGTLVDIEMAALPLRYGNHDAVQIIARDITDRVRAEEELRVREARLQLLASGTHEAIWEWTPERKELWTNDAYRTMAGTPGGAESFFEEWLSHVHPDDRKKAAAVITRATESWSSAWWHEYRMLHEDGSERVILERGHTAVAPSGERRLIGAMLDVTPLREAERMRAAAEAKFRSIVEQSMVAVYMISGNRLTYINETGANMLGYTAEELMSMDATRLLHEDDRSNVRLGGTSLARIRRKDGTLLHAAIYHNEIVAGDEKFIIGTSIDVTESVLARKALELSEQRYRGLVDDVTDILYTLDAEGRFVSLSPSFERSTGHRIEEWIGRPFVELFTSRSLPQAIEHFQQTLRGHGGAIREYEVLSSSGAVVMLEVSAQPRYVDGGVAGTIGMARDVTEYRNISRKLEEAKRMSSLGQVAASLAHEFNNVLMGIQPFVEVLARNVQKTPRVTDAFGHITRAISRGKRASQEILRFANPKEPQLFSIDVPAWLPSLMQQLAATQPSTVALTSTIAADARLMKGDAGHLEQVITNLIFNARDAMNGHGGIHVSATTDGQFVQISVSDDGPGVPAHMLERIFEPLYTTKRNGTGLGLAIAQRLMERQGGSLSVENRVEGGAVFHVRVPLAEAPAPQIETTTASTTGIKRILLVEDDASVGAGLEALLNSEGYETTWVRAGAEACEAARRMQPQVAIIDVNLPDGNGCDLVPMLRVQQTDLPILLSTGHVEHDLSDEKKRIMSLMKPYEFDELLTAIGELTTLG